MRTEQEIRDRIADYEQRREHYDSHPTREFMDRSHETTLLINLLEWVLETNPFQIIDTAKKLGIEVTWTASISCAAGPLSACPHCGDFYVEGVSTCGCGWAQEMAIRAEMAAEDAALPEDLRGGPNSDPEACPGCGSKPGEGLNPDCNHEAGCGFWRAENIATGQDWAPEE